MILLDDNAETRSITPQYMLFSMLKKHSSSYDTSNYVDRLLLPFDKLLTVSEISHQDLRPLHQLMVQF